MLTCEQVIDNINHHLRLNRTGQQIRKDDVFQISLIKGMVDSFNDEMEAKKEDDK